MPRKVLNKTTDAAAAAAVAAPAPATTPMVSDSSDVEVVSSSDEIAAPAETPKKRGGGRKKKEAVKAETDEEVEEVNFTETTIEGLTALNKSFRVILKNLEKADSDNEDLVKIIKATASLNKKLQTFIKEETPKKAELKIALTPAISKFMREYTFTHDENTEFNGTKTPEMSRGDMMKYISALRKESNCLVLDAEQKPLKNKPYYINKKDQPIGQFFEIIRKEIVSRGNANPEILEEGNKLPAYIYHTSVMKYLSYVFQTQN